MGFPLSLSPSDLFFYGTLFSEPCGVMKGFYGSEEGGGVWEMQFKC